MCSSCPFQKTLYQWNFVLNSSQWQNVLKRFSMPMNTRCAQENFLTMSPLIETAKTEHTTQTDSEKLVPFCRKIIALARTQIAIDEASQQVSHQIPRIMSITSVSKPKTFSLYSLAFGGSRLGISMSLISPAASLR